MKKLMMLLMISLLLVGSGMAAEGKLPELQAETVAEGLHHPWDLAQLPDHSLLFTQRGGSLSLIKEGQVIHIADIPGVKARGEGGLMGLAVDADFEDNRLIYLAYNTQSDVRVSRFRLTESLSLEDQRNIITGLPANPSGRHSGAQLEMAGDGTLFVGTGDAANGDNPQNPRSLGGKVLRVNREGEGLPGNLPAPFDPRVFSFGHRNIQGLALFAEVEKGQFGFSAEHGSWVDDEMNLLVSGNFGWAPGLPYDEGVPMTDLDRFPDAVTAAWSSGSRTIAVSGLAQIRGSHWGAYEGALVMGVLKDRQLRVVWLEEGKTAREQVLFENQFGRIRAVRLGLDGHLYLTTDNGQNDRIIRISPGQD